MAIEHSLTQKFIQTQATDDKIIIINEILKVKLYDDYLFNKNVLCKCIKGNDLLVVPDEM